MTSETKLAYLDIYYEGWFNSELNRSFKTTISSFISSFSSLIYLGVAGVNLVVCSADSSSWGFCLSSIYDDKILGPWSAPWVIIGVSCIDG